MRHGFGCIPSGQEPDRDRTDDRRKAEEKTKVAELLERFGFHDPNTAPRWLDKQGVIAEAKPHLPQDGSV
jgi:hypothetical protein